MASGKGVATYGTERLTSEPRIMVWLCDFGDRGIAFYCMLGSTILRLRLFG